PVSGPLASMRRFLTPCSWTCSASPEASLPAAWLPSPRLQVVAAVIDAKAPQDNAAPMPYAAKDHDLPPPDRQGVFVSHWLLLMASDPADRPDDAGHPLEDDQE